MSARLTDLLPPDGRAALDAILARSRTMLGPVQPIQTIVTRALDQFEILLDGGISPAEICQLLAEGGVSGVDGKPVPKGTLTSALCRARKPGSSSEHAPSHDLRRATASSFVELRSAADNSVQLPETAPGCIELHPTSENGNELSAAASGCEGLRNAAIEIAPLQSPASAPASTNDRREGGHGPPAPMRERNGVSSALQRGAMLLAISNLEKTYDED